MRIAARLAGILVFASWCVLLGLVGLEAVLQLGAWYVRTTAPERPNSWLTEYRRILCLGDSNTYGVFVERPEAYPQQLEALWNREFGSPRVEVLNLGVAGTNSSRLVSILPEMLERLRPDVVLVMIGVNDYWTRAVEVGAASEVAISGGGFIKRHSRVYMIYEMLLRLIRPRELELIRDPISGLNGGGDRVRFGDDEFEFGWVRAKRIEDGEEIDETPERPSWFLVGNLHRVVEHVRASGAEVGLMTYPSERSFYRRANRLLRQVARDTDSRLIDTAAAIAAVCPEPCKEMFFADDHPRPVGYRVVAEAIVESFSRD